MRFRKNIDKDLIVNDVRDKFMISNKYFSFNDTNYPWDSFQFQNYLKVGYISVIENDEHSKFYKKLQPFVREDKTVIEEQAKKVEEVKEAEKVAKKRRVKILKAEQKKVEKQKERVKKIEEEKLKKIKVLTSEEAMNQLVL